MHLHSCIVSYKRRALTERTLVSYLDTVTVPQSVVIVDNGSPSDVTNWLTSMDVPVLLLGANMYPGFATNRGWETMPPETTLLHRIDNDTEFLPGWCDEMIAAFDDPEVGQYGHVAAGDEAWTQWPTWPVGGRSVIARRLWDEGLRYSETPWPQAKIQEDHLLTMNVWTRGYRRVFGTRPGIANLDDGDEVYRRETHADRGLAV